MGVRCGYCGDTHSNTTDVETCTMRFLRRKPKLHPRNEAAFAAFEENARRRREAQKVRADAERNLAGVQAARAALRQAAPAALRQRPARSA